jgi:riboflavin synthase
MFTGIIREVSEIRKIDRSSDLYRLEVFSKDIVKTAAIGASVAVNGVCLTIVKKSAGSLSFDAMQETIRKTAFSALKEGGKVNLEGALCAGEPIDGHFVLGHVDCVGKVLDVVNKGNDISMVIGVPKEFNRFVVEKGSVAIDGVSLTVSDVNKDGFSVYLIPHTLKNTTLGTKKMGDGVNVEFDILGKYVFKRSDTRLSSSITDTFLKDSGYC